MLRQWLGNMGDSERTADYVEKRSINKLEIQVQSESDVEAKPDGGWGWVIVLCAFMNNAITDGIIYSSGLVLSELIRMYDLPAAHVSWIFSLVDSVALLSAPIAAVLINRFAHRPVIIAGSVLVFFGLVVSSLTYHIAIEILFFTIGGVCGFGFGLVFMSGLGVLLYFDKKKALANGIAACGSGFGTFAFPPLTAFLLNTYGLGGAFLILGAIALNSSVFGSLFRPIKPSSKGRIQAEPLLRSTEDSTKEKAKRRTVMPKWSLYRSPTMTLISISCFFQSLGWFVPYIYLADHAIRMGSSRESASILVSIVGISNTVGRLLCGWLSDRPKIGVLLVNNVGLTLAGFHFLIFEFFITYEWLIFYCIILGLVLATTAGTRPILIASFLGAENVNDAFGFLLVFYGLGNLLGVPLAGWLCDIYGGYKVSFYVSGGFILLSAILCYPLRCLSRWEKSRKN